VDGPGDLSTSTGIQEAIIAQQQKAMEVLTAQLKEQAAQIQQVRGQVQSNKPVPEFVSN
jgi:hypothetical protein